MSYEEFCWKCIPWGEQNTTPCDKMHNSVNPRFLVFFVIGVAITTPARRWRARSFAGLWKPTTSTWRRTACLRRCSPRLPVPMGTESEPSFSSVCREMPWGQELDYEPTLRGEARHVQSIGSGLTIQRQNRIITGLRGVPVVGIRREG